MFGSVPLKLSYIRFHSLDSLLETSHRWIVVEPLISGQSGSSVSLDALFRAIIFLIEVMPNERLHLSLP